MIPAAWADLALRPPRAHGEPLFSARIRARPEDFQVDEELGFAPAGAGPHWLMRLRKRGANTEWVARELARRAGVKPYDVGFAGLKDRHAVATQWFTVPVGKPSQADWLALRGDGYEVLEVYPHNRKLRRGALAGNRFVIVLREVSPTVDREALRLRLEQLAGAGVPKYFGPQRFGRELGNLRRALVAARAFGDAPRECNLPAEAAGQKVVGIRWRNRDERGFALSAARSLIFNTVLGMRVTDGSWCGLQPGDIANFDAAGTIFAVPSVDESLVVRLAAGELHATGPLWGVTQLAAQGSIGVLEREAVDACAPLGPWLLAEGLRGERRALRLRVRELQHEWLADAGSLRLSFALTAGAFATTVLHELALVEDAASKSDQADSST